VVLEVNIGNLHRWSRNVVEKGWRDVQGDYLVWDVKKKWGDVGMHQMDEKVAVERVCQTVIGEEIKLELCEEEEVLEGEQGLGSVVDDVKRLMGSNRYLVDHHFGGDQSDG
jgi:hypothetical protein